MPILRPLTTLLATLPLACTTSPDTTSSGAVSSTTTDSSESHTSQATHEEPTSTAHASTNDQTTGSTGHGHASEATGDTHADTAATTGELSPVDAYCSCMLERCHDQYHATWGEEHESSEAMCVAAATALPSVGMPATMGNSLECRQHYCDLGEAEPGACDSAIGGGPCV